MTDEKKMSAILKIQEALKSFGDELLQETGTLSEDVKKKIEKLLEEKIKSVDNALGQEIQSTKNEIKKINEKLLYLEKLISGSFEKRATVDQNNQSEVSFSNNFDFSPKQVRYTITGKEHLGIIHSDGNIIGEHIVNGNIGKKGDGNQQGKIQFSARLDPETKILFLGENKGVQSQLEEIRNILLGMQNKMKAASEALK